ncbi:MAG: ABC transporter substrate-binding protein, partial [Pseudomonadota bacterium]
MAEARDKKKATHGIGQSRRQFIATSGAVAGAAAFGFPFASDAAKRDPSRGGTLRFASRADSRGLDQHRNYYYYVSHPLAATSMGLMDYSADMEIVPGIAVENTVSKDLKTYTFKLRKGATYHNGRDVDAESVKWNFARVLDPKIGHPTVRAPLKNIDTMDILDKWTIRINLKTPSGVFLSNVAYYPAQLMAPDSAEQANSQPIGCGPFKFKSWKKFQRTEMDRFENWYETDAKGNALPYLDKIIGLPKKEDSVRLTSLRTGEADLIDNMAYANAAGFAEKYKGKFQTWDIPQVGTAMLYFNMKNGPFSPANPQGKLLRQAAAHAISQDAIHQAIFHGLSTSAKGYYGPESPWNLPDVKAGAEYDPDKAKFLIKKAGGVGEPILLTSRDAYSYMHQQGELIQAMWSEVGFKVKHEILPYSLLKQKWGKGDFHADATGHSYRPDPDGFYFRHIFSDGGTNKLRCGFVNDRCDKLIIEAKQTLDMDKRKEIYTEVENIVVDEVPMIFNHYIPLTSAGVMNLKGYAPAFNGPYSIA